MSSARNSGGARRDRKLSSAGRSVVIMGTSDHVCGFVTMADEVRPESRAAIASLRASGVKEVVMLTGDNAATANRIGDEVGITSVQAELLPADKVSAVETLVGSTAWSR
jgi:Cd2+/Zn2+-exporting ATPase